MRTLLVTHRSFRDPGGGRALLSLLTRDALQDLLGTDLVVHELAWGPEPGARAVVRALRGWIDGVSVAQTRRLVEQVGRDRIEVVFLDGSNLGELARAVRRAHPRVRIITFLHNVEARFFLGSLRQERSLHALGVLGANYLAERKAVRHSDRLVCLTERDLRLLRRLYGRAGTDVCPMAVRDARAMAGRPPVPATPGYALFVGGPFYANRAGIRWFARNVAPAIPLRTLIVGRGFERLRGELEVPGKVDVVGGVDDLAPWYAGAGVVVAPIFDGSGMKTKVAEALMFGKKVIGTPDAFAGYEAVADAVGRRCTTAREFIHALRDPDALGTAGFDPRMRALYDLHYSPPAYRARLRAILLQGGGPDANARGSNEPDL